MALRFRQYKYIIYTVLAVTTIVLWVYSLLNGLSVIDWTIQSERGFARAWNYAISREGAVQVTGGLAVLMLVTVLVDIQRERRLTHRRSLREGVLKRRIERARGGLASSLPQSAALPTQQAGAQHANAELKIRLTVLDHTPARFTRTPTGMLSKDEKGDKIALVDFYREVDSSSTQSIDVRAHVEFYNLGGKRLARVNDGFWHEEHKELTQRARFRIADSKQLLIAVLDRKRIRVFDGRLVFHRRGYPGFSEFIFDGEPLEGNIFLVHVRLIGTGGGATVLDETLRFSLNAEPDLMLTPVDEGKPGEATSNEGIVIGLGALMREGSLIMQAVETSHVTHPHKDNAEKWARGVEDFFRANNLRRYIDRFSNEAITHRYEGNCATANTRPLLNWLLTRIMRLEGIMKELDGV